MDIEKRNKIISAVLIVVIIGLGYWLYRSIVDPYNAELERQRVTEQTRLRMSDIRDALNFYKNNNDNKFPKELDELVTYLKSDSLVMVRADSLYNTSFKGRKFYIDSLIYTIRIPITKFNYALNDTIRPNIYLLADPGGKDKIGSLERTTLLNAANWE